jgi:polysaccharide export outer membrane protein
LQPLKEGGVLEENILLRDGDLFNVPTAEVKLVYILGEVESPGAYEFPNEDRVTATQAITWANGPTSTANVSEGMLVRQGIDGQRTEISVDYEAMLFGREPNVEVQPGDLIFVPHSAAKAMGSEMARIIPGMIQYPIYRLVR